MNSTRAGAIRVVLRLQAWIRSFGDVLRGKFKFDLSAFAVAPAVILRDEAMLFDAQLLGVTTEAAVFKKFIAERGKMTPAKLTNWCGSITARNRTVSQMPLLSLFSPKRTISLAADTVLWKRNPENHMVFLEMNR